MIHHQRNEVYEVVDGHIGVVINVGLLEVEGFVFTLQEVVDHTYHVGHCDITIRIHISHGDGQRCIESVRRQDAEGIFRTTAQPVLGALYDRFIVVAIAPLLRIVQNRRFGIGIVVVDVFYEFVEVIFYEVFPLGVAGALDLLAIPAQSLEELGAVLTGEIVVVVDFGVYTAILAIVLVAVCPVKVPHGAEYVFAVQSQEVFLVEVTTFGVTQFQIHHQFVDE